MSADLVGRVLNNRYRVEAFVGAGSMGSVYRVWDLQRSVPLAMKVLHSDAADDPAAFSSFQREAQLLESLAHPNIVPFYGVHRMQTFDFLLEGFIDGPSLKELLRQRQGSPLPVADTLVFLKAICAALGYAHHRGFVHCDLKPANVMLDSGGRVYLTDFGIARHSDSATTTLAGAGTPAYMAPEQIRGETVTPATDVYALGVLLFEQLTGQRPFRGEAGASGSPGTGSSAAERVRIAHLTQPPPDPCDLNPHIDRALAAVVLRALEKEPGKRFASAPELFEAACAAVRMAPASVPERVVLPEQVVDTPSPPPGPPPLAKRPRSALVWLAMAGGIVIALVLGIAFLGGSGSNGQPSQIAGVVAVAISATAEEEPIFIPSKTAASTAMAPATRVPPTHPVTNTAQATDNSRTPPATGIPPTPTAQASVNPRTPPACTTAGEIWVSPLDGMKLVCIPAGEFFHSLENTPVRLGAFWADQTEITNAMYAICVQAGTCSPPRAGQSNEPVDYYGQSGGGNFPVTRLDWNQASQYCTWAGRRLLTEMEWQKTARGTDKRIYPWGDASINCQRANISGCANSYTVVGSYLSGASPYGALDMSGNVYEWVDATCAQGKLAMGGSWYDSPEKAVVYETACRTADSQSSKLGFRCGY